MKKIILSADNNLKLYSVPDEVADDLGKYSFEFNQWLFQSPYAEKYRKRGVSNDETYIYVVYNEKDFIEYLNQWIFPDNPSVFIENICEFNEKIPDKYAAYQWYNF